MIREWPGQTKEEWIAEYRRDKNLTPEEQEKELNEFLDEIKKRDEEREREKVAQKQQNSENLFANCDHPNSLENDEATILWIVVMAVATIFKGNWIIWIIATIIWRRYITRHKIKK
jgi:hypothetical protein